MKQQINKWGAMLLSLLLLGSCYDDNGNYDYTDIGSVSVEITADTIVMYGRELKMEPKKVTYQNSSEEEYEWSWELAEKSTGSVPEFREIGHSKVLYLESLLEEIGQYDLRLSAIHKATGVRTMVHCDFTVDNGLSRVYLLLTKQSDGRYDLDAVTYPGGEKRMNQYSLMNNQETISNAERLFYVNSSFSQDERLYLTQSENGQTLSPIDLTFQGNADEWFFEAPQPLHVTHVLTDLAARDQFMVCDGGIYYMNNVNSPLKASVRCALQDNSEYRIAGVGTMHNSSGLGRYAFYDEQNGRFIEWNFTYGTYYIQPLSTTAQIAASAFDPQQIGKQFFADISGKEDRLWFLFEDAQSNLWLYTFKDGAGTYYNVTLVPNEAPLQLDAATQEQFKKATAFCAVKTADKFYYAVDNTIWIYNTATHKTEDEPFYTSPDTEMRFSKIFYRDKDDLEVTFAGNSNGKGTFFRAKVDNFGRMAAPTEEEGEPFKQYDGFGEIHDFIYKYKVY